MQIFETISLTKSAAVARIVLNRPDKLNSLTRSMCAELLAALTDIEGDGTLRCLVLAGAGRAFSAGQDLGERRSVTQGERIDLGDALSSGLNRIVLKLRELPIPVVAAVNGIAAGAGASLALACDIVVAGRSARFAMSFSNVGLIPDSGMTHILPRLVGPARATALSMLGETVDAAEAERFGMIWKATDDAELDTSVAALAERLASRPTLAMASIKKAFAPVESGLARQLELEAALQRQAGFSEDYREGLLAFFEKRPARFQGK